MSKSGKTAKEGISQLRNKAHKHRHLRSMNKIQRTEYNSKKRAFRNRRIEINDTFGDIHSSKDIMPEKVLDNIYPEELYVNMDKEMDKRDIDDPSKRTRKEIKTLNKDLSKLRKIRIKNKATGKYIQGKEYNVNSLNYNKAITIDKEPRITHSIILRCENPFLYLSNDVNIKNYIISGHTTEFKAINSVYNDLEPLKYIIDAIQNRNSNSKREKDSFIIGDDCENLIFTKKGWNDKMKSNGCSDIYEIELSNELDSDTNFYHPVFGEINKRECLILIHKIYGKILTASFFVKCNNNAKKYKWLNYIFCTSYPM